MADEEFIASEFEWSDDVSEACKKFKLGDLIADPPIALHREAGIANEVASPGKVGGEDPLVQGGAPPYAIITTQTCDIRDPEHRQPWVQVSPVYAFESAEDIPRRQYLYPLRGPDFDGGAYVADLRVEFPIEKSVLVGRDVVEGLQDEDDEILFAETLGRRRDRAALADVINDVLYRRFKKKAGNNSNKAKKVLAEIHRIGLAIEEGNRLEPIAVQLHIITAEGEISDDSREWFETYWDDARRRAADHDPSLRLLPNEFHNGSAVEVTRYDDLIFLDWRR